ncbi:hypothetical protein [Rhizobium sp. 21-4511-3d]
MRRMTKFILMGLSAMSSPTVTPVIAAAQDLELRVRTGGVVFTLPMTREIARIGVTSEHVSEMNALRCLR